MLHNLNFKGNIVITDRAVAFEKQVTLLLNIGTDKPVLICTIPDIRGTSYTDNFKYRTLFAERIKELLELYDGIDSPVEFMTGKRQELERARKDKENSLKVLRKLFDEITTVARCKGETSVETLQQVLESIGTNPAYAAAFELLKKNDR